MVENDEPGPFFIAQPLGPGFLARYESPFPPFRCGQRPKHCWGHATPALKGRATKKHSPSGLLTKKTVTPNAPRGIASQKLRGDLIPAVPWRWRGPDHWAGGRSTANSRIDQPPGLQPGSGSISTPKGPSIFFAA